MDIDGMGYSRIDLQCDQVRKQLALQEDILRKGTHFDGSPMSAVEKDKVTQQIAVMREKLELLEDVLITRKSNQQLEEKLKEREREVGELKKTNDELKNSANSSSRVSEEMSILFESMYTGIAHDLENLKGDILKEIGYLYDQDAAVYNNVTAAVGEMLSSELGKVDSAIASIPASRSAGGVDYDMLANKVAERLVGSNSLVNIDYDALSHAIADKTGGAAINYDVIAEIVGQTVTQSLDKDKPEVHIDETVIEAAIEKAVSQGLTGGVSIDYDLLCSRISGKLVDKDQSLLIDADVEDISDRVAVKLLESGFSANAQSAPALGDVASKLDKIYDNVFSIKDDVDFSGLDDLAGDYLKSNNPEILREILTFVQKIREKASRFFLGSNDMRGEGILDNLGARLNNITVSGSHALDVVLDEVQAKSIGLSVEQESLINYRDICAEYEATPILEDYDAMIRLADYKNSLFNDDAMKEFDELTMEDISNELQGVESIEALEADKLDSIAMLKGELTTIKLSYIINLEPIADIAPAPAPQYNMEELMGAIQELKKAVPVEAPSMTERPVVRRPRKPKTPEDVPEIDLSRPVGVPSKRTARVPRSAAFSSVALSASPFNDKETESEGGIAYAAELKQRMKESRKSRKRSAK